MSRNGLHHILIVVAIAAIAIAAQSTHNLEAHDPLQSGSHEAHRRGDESLLEQMLTQHRSAAEEEAKAQRVSIRRAIHEQHIQAHLAVDPDLPTEATDEVRQRFLTSRKKLLESAAKPTTGMRLVFLVGIAVLPMVGFGVWMRL